MSLNCPSGGTKDSIWLDSQGLSLTQGWNLTSLRMEGLANDKERSGRPERWEFIWTSPYISHFTRFPSLSIRNKWKEEKIQNWNNKINVTDIVHLVCMRKTTPGISIQQNLIWNTVHLERDLALQHKFISCQSFCFLL